MLNPITVDNRSNELDLDMKIWVWYGYGENRELYSVVVLDMVIGVSNLYPSPNPTRILYIYDI